MIDINLFISLCFRGHFLSRTLGSQEGGKEEYSDHSHRNKISFERAEVRVRSRPGIGGKNKKTRSGEKAAKQTSRDIMIFFV